MEALNSITVPEKIYCFLRCENKIDELRRNAFLLYPYIQNKTISHGRAAEILGISKWELITLYSDEGLPYLNMTPEELENDIQNARSAIKRLDK